MIKSICIMSILFSASICFSQSSEIQVKDISTSSSVSKSGLDPNTKAPLKSETIGTTAMIDLGTPILEPNSPPKGNGNENTDQKKYNNGKNATKPN